MKRNTGFKDMCDKDIKEDDIVTNTFACTGMPVYYKVIFDKDVPYFEDVEHISNRTPIAEVELEGYKIESEEDKTINFKPIKYKCPKHGEVGSTIVSTEPGHEGDWCGVCFLEHLDTICERVEEIKC
ncbi:MAG: hypothetical protein GY861_13835 [bacterium]|nr:hypothetical protein [bacterium]